MLPIIKRNDSNRAANWINEFFNEGWPLLRSSFNEPAVNIMEDKEHYHIDIAAPGRTKEEFQIHLKDSRTMYVTLQEKDEHTCTSKEDCKVLQREFQLNRFEETIALPDDVDTERISAKMENGILHISLPKMDEKQRLRSAKMIAIE